MTDGVNTSHFIMKPDYLSGPSEFWISNDDTDGDGVADTEIFSVHRSAQSSYRNPLTGDEDSVPFGDNPQQIDYEDFWPRYKVDFYYNYSHNPLAHNWLQYPVTPSTPANKNSNLVHVCEAARNQQVQIFTVGFETTADSTATMKKCASSHAHHFEADGQNIDQVFAAIARSIQKLKLVN